MSFTTRHDSCCDTYLRAAFPALKARVSVQLAFLTAVSASLGIGGAACDNDVEPQEAEVVLAEPQEAETEAPKPMKGMGQYPLKPTVDTVSRVEEQTLVMQVEPSPPAEIIPEETLRDPNASSIALAFFDYPGHYEVIDDASLRSCLAKRGEKPFEVTFYRVFDAQGQKTTVIGAIEGCPALKATEKTMLDVEKRQKGATGSPSPGSTTAVKNAQAAPDPNDTASDSEILGWSGRGFYKVSGEADPASGPLENKWRTFCDGLDETMSCDRRWPMR